MEKSVLCSLPILQAFFLVENDEWIRGQINLYASSRDVREKMEICAIHAILTNQYANVALQRSFDIVAYVSSVFLSLFLSLRSSFCIIINIIIIFSVHAQPFPWKHRTVFEHTES